MLNVLNDIKVPMMLLYEGALRLLPYMKEPLQPEFHTVKLLIINQFVINRDLISWPEINLSLNQHKSYQTSIYLLS